jgi:hypothetical protein
MSRSSIGSTVAGAGGIAFGVLTAAALVVSGAPGGSYAEADAANYVKISHFPIVVMAGYLAVLAVLGLICLLAYLREGLAAQPDRALTANIFWGVGVASAASFAVGWGLVTGIALAAAEGGSGASVPPATTYVLSDTMLNVVFGSGGIMLGFALIVLMLASPGVYPSWVRWMSLVLGVLALTAPFFFTAPAVPLWGIVIGVWLLVARPALTTSALAPPSGPTA